MIMTEEDYNKELKEYLKERGPNKGNGFFGKWAWDANERKTFDNLLEKRNIVVDRKPNPVSQATPSSFSEFWRRTST
jgi:hypothetical protein